MSPLDFIADIVTFGADYTADAPIYITLTLGAGDSDTQLLLANGTNLLTDNSGVTFSNFYINILGYPPGTTLNGGCTAGNAFGLLTFNANSTGAVFAGLPGLPGGPGLPNFFSTQLSIGISLASPAERTETIVLFLSPTPVPEPSTWAMMLLGFTGLGYAGFRSNRARRSVAA
ncbi:MAG TPA: PEPxxWA-CTERM sorting domain-containing protein [Roseiarcus sp.]